jgi:putative nucleotidyltransferase with HDIG domain
VSAPGTAKDARELGLRLEKIILGRIADDKLVLPAAPALATRCMSLLEEKEANLKGCASIMEHDPVLSAQVLRIANSVAYGGGTVRTVEQAVMRLGAQKLRSFFLTISAFKIFDSRDPRISKATSGLWEHSLATGLLARDLSALAGSADADLAYLTGLLHDVGKPILASMLLEAERLASSSRPSVQWFSSEVWIDAVQRSHRAVGAALAAKWRLPETVVQTIKEGAEFDPVNRNGPANFVRFANAVTKQLGLYVGAVDAEEIDALIMIGRTLLGIDDEVLERLSAELKARVRELD